METREATAARTPSPRFWSGRRVLVTGHTGFKGAWLTLWLHRLGARVTGFALPPESGRPSLFDAAEVGDLCESFTGDLRDPSAVDAAVRAADPEIVFHLAAQALVRRAARCPVDTWAVNVLGLTHLLEALRGRSALWSTVVATSDKVYANDGSGRPMVETNRLGGSDAYSASKAAAELAVHSFAQSCPELGALVTARGGNVIGGGDFAEDRIAPDCVRARLADTPLILRHPQATRPWQHVLDCLCGYLLFAEVSAVDPQAPRALNFGPAAAAPITVSAFAEMMMAELAPGARDLVRHEPAPEPESLEAPRLQLDSSAARSALGWANAYDADAAIAATASWYNAWRVGADMSARCRRDIDAYVERLSLSARGAA